MHPLFLFIILLLIAVVVIIGKLLQRLAARKDARQLQKGIDRNTEWQLNEGRFDEVTIEMLARHSDIEKIARIVSVRIYDCIKLAVHPKKLSKIVQKLGLFAPARNNWSDKEIQLAALIQQYILRNLDAHDLKVYQSEVCENVKSGFTELNKTFLTKVHDDMLVWSHLDN